MDDLLILLGYRSSGTTLPVSIIVLKISIVHRKCKYGGVMVEPKIIIGSLNPLNLFRSELWKPGEIILTQSNLPFKCKTFFSFFLSFRLEGSTL